MSRKRPLPQDKKTSTNYSLMQRVIDKVHEEAELAEKSDSAYLNDLLLSHFGMKKFEEV